MKSSKSVRKKLVAELDRVFSLWIRARDHEEFGGICSLCHSQKAIQCAHLISRSKHSVRWDPRNAYAQCAGCNVRHEFHSQYYTSWWVARHGVESYQQLFRDSNKIAKFSRQDLEDMIQRYKERP
jgi:nitrate/TMAO reductase-like tetraheme cytochrome c subunit